MSNDPGLEDRGSPSVDPMTVSSGVWSLARVTRGVSTSGCGTPLPCKAHSEVRTRHSNRRREAAVLVVVLPP